MRIHLIVAFIILSVAAVACGPKPDEIAEPGEEAETQAPEAVDESPIETTEAVAPSEVFFLDDFSDPASGWAESSASEGMMGYLDGGYHISVIEPFSQVFSIPGKSSYGDVSVGVDVRRIGEDGSCRGEGCQVSTYGLICRYQDQDNFYGAGVSGNFHGFFEVVDGQLYYFGQPGLFSSGDIGLNPADASNHLRLDCVDTYLSFYLNGQLLDEAFTDSIMASGPAIPSGDVGLYVRSSNTATDILFDNFDVKQP